MNITKVFRALQNDLFRIPYIKLYFGINPQCMILLFFLTACVCVCVRACGRGVFSLTVLTFL